MKKSISILLLLFVCIVLAKAQLNFQFLPEVYGRTVDGLGSFQVQNLQAERLTGKVSISVRENRTGSLVVIITSPLVQFNPGISVFPKSTFKASAFTFSSNPYGAIASQTRNIPPGEYTFCFHYTPLDKAIYDEYENCFEAEIQPLVPLTLLNPAHLDTICQKRPVLSWQPPMPFGPGMRFRLLLTEKKGGAGVEDLLINRPLLLLDNISSSSINYPSANPELKEGKTYYWQVLAQEKGIIISKSEIWEFTVQCNEPVKPAPNDSYRELKLLVNGNYYITNRFLKFSFRNDYGMQKLRYSILDLEKDGEAIKYVPEIKIQTGFNKIDIDLGEIGLKPGGQYVLKVFPFNEPPVEVRFIYKEDDGDQL